MPLSLCISLTSSLEEKSPSKDEPSSSDKDENERMQVKKKDFYFHQKKLTFFLYLR